MLGPHEDMGALILETHRLAATLRLSPQRAYSALSTKIHFHEAPTSAAHYNIGQPCLYGAAVGLSTVLRA